MGPCLFLDTVYPKKYAHGFVVLCFVVVLQSFIMNSHEVFIHIHQGCFTGAGAIVRLPQCQWSKPDGYGKISQCITTAKQKSCAYFLGYTVCPFHLKLLLLRSVVCPFGSCQWWAYIVSAVAWCCQVIDCLNQCWFITIWILRDYQLNTILLQCQWWWGNVSLDDGLVLNSCQGIR